MCALMNPCHLQVYVAIPRKEKMCGDFSNTLSGGCGKPHKTRQMMGLQCLGTDIQGPLQYIAFCVAKLSAANISDTILGIALC